MMPSLYLIAKTLVPVTIGCLYEDKTQQTYLLLFNLQHTVYAEHQLRRHPLGHYLVVGGVDMFHTRQRHRYAKDWAIIRQFIHEILLIILTGRPQFVGKWSIVDYKFLQGRGEGVR